jgi:hypothetical protein
MERARAPTPSPSVGAALPVASGRGRRRARCIARSAPDLVPGDSSQIVVHALMRTMCAGSNQWSSATGVASVSATGWAKAMHRANRDSVSADTMRRSLGTLVRRESPAEADRRRVLGRLRRRSPTRRLCARHQRRRICGIRAVCAGMADTLFSELAAIIAREHAPPPMPGRRRRLQRSGDVLRQAQPLASVQRVHVVPWSGRRGGDRGDAFHLEKPRSASMPTTQRSERRTATRARTAS